MREADIQTDRQIRQERKKATKEARGASERTGIG